MTFERLTARLIACTLAPLFLVTVAAQNQDASAQGAVAEALTYKVGDSLALKLAQIKAGQPAVGKDQIAYKIGRFDGVDWPANIPPPLNGALKPGRWFSDDQKMFEDVSEANGQTARSDQLDKNGDQYSTKVDRRTAAGDQADPGDPGHPERSYSVRFDGKGGALKGEVVPPGNNQGEMKTVVLAPDRNFYLTDGHHRTLVYSEMNRGGRGGAELDSFTLNLVLSKDYSGLPDSNNSGSSMDEFWAAAANDGQVWLKALNEKKPGYDYLPGVEGSPTVYHVDSIDLALFQGSLPSAIALREFADDPYRGLLYYCRGIGWDKPSSGPAVGLPFLEFYWAEQIQKAIPENRQLDLHTPDSPYNLADLGSYTDAVFAVSKWISEQPPGTLIGSSGHTADNMGQIKFDPKALAILIDASNSESSKPKTLKPKDSDEAGANERGKLPKPGKWAYAWAARYGGGVPAPLVAESVERSRSGTRKPIQPLEGRPEVAETARAIEDPATTTQEKRIRKQRTSAQRIQVQRLRIQRLRLRVERLRAERLHEQKSRRPKPGTLREKRK